MIGEQVVQAHLQNFCPGDLGFPVTGPLPAGPSLGPLRPADHARAGRPQARLRLVGARGLPDLIAPSWHVRPINPV
jgi:hypothetical protein